ncbi:hypothetical protein HID58_095875 [Brassica napus]|uniref:Uncharacterized protein n=1 Tax=Brassica napus TaxID=3708 RepID=A0ABQ7X287_BRANA|nr:hypothetical protein HID58_095875 [Brassica napus]
MSQVLESAVLDGLLAGVSRQGGVELPNMLRNMLHQFTQNPQIMNTVQQIAQQVDGQEIENMMQAKRKGKMQALISLQCPIHQPDDYQPLQANVQPMVNMIEHCDPLEDIFHAMVENAAMSHEDLADDLCDLCEYVELLRRDIKGRLHDDKLISSVRFSLY